MQLVNQQAKSYSTALSEVLAMMASALKGAGQNHEALGQAWFMVVSPEVDQALLVPTCHWFCRNATWFPTPAEFITRALEIKREHETRVVLENTKRALKAEEAVRAKVLEARYPDMDAGKFQEILERTIAKCLPDGSRFQQAAQGSREEDFDLSEDASDSQPARLHIITGRDVGDEQE